MAEESYKGLSEKTKENFKQLREADEELERSAKKVITLMDVALFFKEERDRLSPDKKEGDREINDILLSEMKD